jgi:hypothetical protein
MLALAEFLVQKKTFAIRKDAYKKRLKIWAIVFISTPNFIASSTSSNATGVELNGLQEKIVGRYDFEALKKTVPEALASVTNASIRGFHRLALRDIDAYSAGVQYGTEEFKRTVYKSHRQVEDKSKW